MERIHEGLADTGFEVPASVETARICRKSGMLANPGVCESDPRGSAVRTEYFAKGSVPTEVCNHHARVTVCAESGGTPTEFCPEKTERTVMVIPDGETGGTDDTNYRTPGPCPIHTSEAVILPEESETPPIVPETEPETTPFVPRDPSEDIRIPVGPGYQ